MSNFSIVFSHPWLLLLLIPAVALTLIPYFRLSKKYRKTRNRITSMVLHMIIMVCAVFLISGMTFTYQIPNNENEIILLVDMSKTEEQSEESRDDFIQTVLYGSINDNYKVGIVTFGFDQRYAVPLTYDVESIYDDYLAAEMPDTSATNVADALTYAASLFNNPESAKIVLITDGKETDKSALTVIRSVSAQGIRVDTANITSSYGESDVQVVGIELPDYHINTDEECAIDVTIQSSSEAYAEIDLYDNGVLAGSWGQLLPAGALKLSVPHTFLMEGLHELYVDVRLEGDSLKENNNYFAYTYLEVFNKILVLERADGESDALKSMLTENDLYTIEVKNIADAAALPQTVDALREYDQIILNNVSEKEMPVGFGDMLYSYVYDYGGGVFTVGGDDENGDANAYSNSSDKVIYGSLYQQMLPVQLINYTPPVGVMVLIDRSTSMAWTYEDREKMAWAKDGAASCLNALTERDYFGIITFSLNYEVVLEPTPRTQEAKILAAIDSLEWIVDGTSYPAAIDRAGMMLKSLTQVAKRHIILVSDGQVPENEVETYENLIKNLYLTAGITFSVVGLGMEEQYVGKMEHAAELGHGRAHNVTNLNNLVREMREDLNAPEIKDLVEETFSPLVYNPASPLVQGLERDYDPDQDGTDSKNRDRLTVQLDGFYGVKVKSAADLVLVGDYEVPIYAQWKLGKGMVGSFMCDLYGNRSAQWITDINGQEFIRRAVGNLMPTENIRPSEISVTFKGENYINQMSVVAELSDGEYIDGQLIEYTDEGENVLPLNAVTQDDNLSALNFYVTAALGKDNNYTRATVVIKKGGVYKIVLNKRDAEGNILATREVYKVFSYSKEYDSFNTASGEDLVSYLEAVALRGNGSLIEDLDSPMEIYKDFVTSFNRTFDPRYIFAITAAVLFVADIAIRKFKFKWIHELIREHKEKKAGK